MREYQQLTEDDRIEIYAVKQAGKTQRTIAECLGVNPSAMIGATEMFSNTLSGFS